MPHRDRFGTVLVFLLLSCSEIHADDSTLPLVMANDNRTPAGEFQNGVLKLHLELRGGRWYPEDEKGQYRDVYAFSEKDHAPQCSGPLIRVPQGTQIHATIRNTLTLPAKIFGLHTHPGDPKEALSLQPGETRNLQFLAGEPGNYLYWATTSDKPLERRRGAESNLFGALVVDFTDAKSDDRIFVLGLWIDPVTFQQIPSINGKSWPYTEHITYKTGETVHWRVIDASFDPHAMHLHGFYFTVNAAGDGEHYEHYSEGQQRKGVTEFVAPGHSFEMTWTPDRAGNWLFHCHMLMHMSVLEALHPKETQPKETEAKGVQPDAYPPMHAQMAGMGGLVLGITVVPAGPSAPVVSKPARKLQLVISENPEKVPLYKLELNDPQAPTKSDKDEKDQQAPILLGPPIVLTRGEETEIEVQNRTTVPTAIHWHGIELESYYDGVAGWTGAGQQITPPIAPGTSFVARMTPPRAGTFIYHTHWHDQKQLLNGLYGPLIVLEPGQKYDPEHDKSFVISIGKYAPFPEMMLLNGAPEPDPVILRPRTPYRFRLINITDNEVDLRIRMVSMERAGEEELAVQWKILAKDGADLPAPQQRYSSEELLLPVGSTCDVVYQSDREGYVEMQISAPLFEAIIMQPFDFIAAK
jgi:manganese oxidase